MSHSKYKHIELAERITRAQCADYSMQQLKHTSKIRLSTARFAVTICLYMQNFVTIG